MYFRFFMTLFSKLSIFAFLSIFISCEEQLKGNFSGPKGHMIVKKDHISLKNEDLHEIDLTKSEVVKVKVKSIAIDGDVLKEEVVQMGHRKHEGFIRHERAFKFGGIREVHANYNLSTCMAKVKVLLNDQHYEIPREEFKEYIVFKTQEDGQEGIEKTISEIPMTFEVDKETSELVFTFQTMELIKLFNNKRIFVQLKKQNFNTKLGRVGFTGIMHIKGFFVIRGGEDIGHILDSKMLCNEAYKLIYLNAYNMICMVHSQGQVWPYVDEKPAGYPNRYKRINSGHFAFSHNKNCGGVSSFISPSDLRQFITEHEKMLVRPISDQYYFADISADIKIDEI